MEEQVGVADEEAWDASQVNQLLIISVLLAGEISDLVFTTQHVHVCNILSSTKTKQVLIMNAASLYVHPVTRNSVSWRNMPLNSYPNRKNLFLGVTKHRHTPLS